MATMIPTELMHGAAMPEVMDPTIGIEDGAAPGPFVLAPQQPPTLETGMTEEDLVQLCRQWKEEARSARESGTEPRDAVWSANVDLYHGRMDFSDKEDWQHQEVMRDATKHADRMAAALKRALMQPGDWFEILDWTPGSDLLHPMIRRLLNVLLSRCSTTTSGYPTNFRHLFGKSAKMGACMAMAASITKDPYSNRVRVDEVDPRELYFDPTGRGMYRVRSREMDAHSLTALAGTADGAGQPLYFADRVAGLQDMRKDTAEADGAQTRGHNEGARPQARQTRLVDEFLFRELLDRDGNVVGRNVLVVMANELRIIRGPEPNPCWHGRDWIVYQSMLDVFLTVYGRAPMEDYGPMARTFTRFTNLLLDGVTVSMLPNYAIKPDMLQDPTQIDDGLRPFKMWYVNEDAMRADEFAERMELGSVRPEAFEVWRGLKGELREMASQNEIDLGTMPKKSGITATEITTVQDAGSDLVIDIAENIDDGFLGPCLELMFWTAVQELDFEDPALAGELGVDIAQVFGANREEWKQRKVSFKASAITGVAERNTRVAKRMQVLQVVGQSEVLTQEFVKEYSPKKFFADLFRDLGINAVDYGRTAEDGAPPIPAETQARIATEEAATARHEQGIGTDERRARAAEQQTAIAAEEAARAAESGGVE